MSKVSLFCVNGQHDLSSRQGRQRLIHTSFKGANPLELNKVQQNIVQDVLIKDYLGSVKMLGLGRAFNYLSKTAGEIQNIAIQNIGTAFVAPIFIVNNPLSKEDDKSKKYSAWRQPLSALIAVPLSIGSNYAVGLWFDEAAKKGTFKRFDMRAMWPENYLKRRYNKISNALKKSDVTQAKFDRRSKEVIDLLNDSEIKDYKTFKTKYGTFQDFIDGVNKVTSKIAAEDLLRPDNEKGLHKLAVRDFLIEKLNFKVSDMYPEKLNRDDVDIKLKNTTALSFLKEFGFDGIEEKQLRTFVNNNYLRKLCMEETKQNAESAEKIFNAIKEVTADPKAFEANKELFINRLSKVGLDDKERKTVSRLCENLLPQKIVEEETISLRNFLKIFDMDDNFFENPKLKWNVNKFILFLDRELQPEKLRNKEAVVRSFVENEITSDYIAKQGEKSLKYAVKIAQKGAQKAGSALSPFGKVLGIFVSIAVIPPQCSFLNWYYPKVMKKCFPKLAASKAEKSKVDDSKGGK